MLDKFGNKITLIEDTRQQANKHNIKHEYFENNDIKIVRSKLPVGDYANIKNMSTVIDTKKDIQEIIGNLTSGHERFRNECDLAKDSGIQLIVLIENKNGVKKIDDLARWYNWRLKHNPKATTGKQLMKMMYTMQEKHGVVFNFCTPEESAEKILKILDIVE